MATIRDVSDYIISRVTADGDSDLNALKLQKLLYYVQAWHLAFNSRRMFDGEFQAWVHGPVNREIYDLYREKKFLYTPFNLDDILDPNFEEHLTEDEKLHINVVLDAYAKFSPSQLEFMTHREAPWQSARRGISPYTRSENVIDEEEMESYYKARL